MSQLLPHIKALRALARAYGQEAERQTLHAGQDNVVTRTMQAECRVALNAAQALEDQMREEGSQ